MINAGYVQRDSRVFMYGQNKKIKKRGAGGGLRKKSQKVSVSRRQRRRWLSPPPPVPSSPSPVYPTTTTSPARTPTKTVPSVVASLPPSRSDPADPLAVDEDDALFAVVVALVEFVDSGTSAVGSAGNTTILSQVKRPEGTKGGTN